MNFTYRNKKTLSTIDVFAQHEGREGFGWFTAEALGTRSLFPNFEIRISKSETTQKS
jgi:hypothetical protein